MNLLKFFLGVFSFAKSMLLFRLTNLSSLRSAFLFSCSQFFIIPLLFSGHMTMFEKSENGQLVDSLVAIRLPIRQRLVLEATDMMLEESSNLWTYDDHGEPMYFQTIKSMNFEGFHKVVFALSEFVCQIVSADVVILYPNCTEEGTLSVTTTESEIQMSVDKFVFLISAGTLTTIVPAEDNHKEIYELSLDPWLVATVLLKRAEVLTGLLSYLAPKKRAVELLSVHFFSAVVHLFLENEVSIGMITVVTPNSVESEDHHEFLADRAPDELVSSKRIKTATWLDTTEMLPVMYSLARQDQENILCGHLFQNELKTCFFEFDLPGNLQRRFLSGNPKSTSEMFLIHHGNHYYMAIMNHGQQTILVFDSMGIGLPAKYRTLFPSSYRIVESKRSIQRAATCGAHAILCAYAYANNINQFRSTLDFECLYSWYQDFADCDKMASAVYAFLKQGVQS